MKTTSLSFCPSLNFSSLFSHLPLSSLFLTFLTLFAVLSANAQVPSYVPTNGLVGYWPFNGNANDESGNGNNGTVNGATLAADRFGNGNRAYYFDYYQEIITSFTLISGTQTRTISFWMKNSNGQKTITPIWYGGNSNQPQIGAAFNVLFNRNETLDQCNCWPDIIQGIGVGADWIYFLKQFNTGDNQWHFYSFVLANSGDSFSQVQIYVDGVLLTSNEIFNYEGNASTSVNTVNSNPLIFGRSLANLGNLNDTQMRAPTEYLDEISIYDRALTADEVLALYNGCNVTPQIVAGNTTPGAFSNSTYTCNNNAGSTYTWAVNNGVIVSGQGTNSVTILWGAEGVGSVSVVETTADGCVGDEVIYDVNVQCVVSGNEITGPVGPEAFSNSTYTCNGAVNSTYNWTVNNGVISSGQGTNTVNILWASTGLGNVSVIETTAEGCVGTTLSQDVVVIPVNVEELSNAMILYPNPATTELNLQTTSDLIGTDLFVFDALGKQILKQQILSTNTIINTSSFAAGNYVVKVGGGVKKFEVVR